LNVDALIDKRDCTIMHERYCCAGAPRLSSVKKNVNQAWRVRALRASARLVLRLYTQSALGRAVASVKSDFGAHSAAARDLYDRNAEEKVGNAPQQWANSVCSGRPSRNFGALFRWPAGC